jgi:hypothetical protein
MRDGWGREANYMLIDCGPHGSLSCGHAHADALSFDLAVRGRTLLVDAGTYTYTGSEKERDYFRSTAAHNTLTIDGESSSVPAGPFSWRETARCGLHSWITSDRFDLFSGSHDGYERLGEPARHTRHVLFLKNDYWIVSDRVETEGKHRYNLYFHPTPETKLKIEEDAARVLLEDKESGDTVLSLHVFGDGGKLVSEEGWVSAQYGRRERAPLCRFEAEGLGARALYTFLVPPGAGASPARVRRIECAAGAAFELFRDDARDLLLTGGHETERAGVVSDFEWSWLRFEREAESLREFVLIRGRSLSLDGRELVRGEGEIDFLAAQFSGEVLRVQMDARCEVELATLKAATLLLNGTPFNVDARASVRVARGRVVAEALKVVGALV